jgi:hypothetical protein
MVQVTFQRQNAPYYRASLRPREYLVRLQVSNQYFYSEQFNSVRSAHVYFVLAKQ